MYIIPFHYTRTRACARTHTHTECSILIAFEYFENETIYKKPF